MSFSSLTLHSSVHLVPGIGHKIRSLRDPDSRVKLLRAFVEANFPSHPTLDYALAVEQVTTAKKDTLILNVDGCIAVAFVDLLRHSQMFNREEADEYIKIGCLNALFVLGRSIGFIGCVPFPITLYKCLPKETGSDPGKPGFFRHHIDQKRLKQPLYRHREYFSYGTWRCRTRADSLAPPATAADDIL